MRQLVDTAQLALLRYARHGTHGEHLPEPRADVDVLGGDR